MSIAKFVNTAKFVNEVVVVDPDSEGHVAMSVFKHYDSGAMFAIDSSYLDQCFEDDTDPAIPDPFSDNDGCTEVQKITLLGV